MKETKMSNNDDLQITKRDIDPLVKRAQDGDREAFGELMSRHQDRVRKTAFAILRNMDDADDVTQDVFVRLLTKLNTFEGNAAFATWLTRIAINASLGRLRKSRGLRFVYLDEPSSQDVSVQYVLPDAGPCTEDQYLTREAHDRLAKAISRLPSDLKNVLSEQVYMDLSMTEIADRQGLTLAAAKSRAHRARRLLSRNLNTTAGLYPKRFSHDVVRTNGIA